MRTFRHGSKRSQRRSARFFSRITSSLTTRSGASSSPRSPSVRAPACGFYVIHDWFGDLGDRSSRLWRPLVAAGGEVRRFNPAAPGQPFSWLTRDHRKLIAVDGEVGFVERPVREPQVGGRSRARHRAVARYRGSRCGVRRSPTSKRRSRRCGLPQASRSIRTISRRPRAWRCVET